MHRFDPLKCAAQITISSVAPPLVAFLCGTSTAVGMGYIDVENLLYFFIFVQYLFKVYIFLNSDYCRESVHHFPTHQLDTFDLQGIWQSCSPLLPLFLLLSWLFQFAWLLSLRLFSFLLIVFGFAFSIATSEIVIVVVAVA